MLFLSLYLSFLLFFSLFYQWIGLLALESHRAGGGGGADDDSWSTASRSFKNDQPVPGSILQDARFASHNEGALVVVGLSETTFLGEVCTPRCRALRKAAGKINREENKVWAKKGHPLSLCVCVSVCTSRWEDHRLISKISVCLYLRKNGKVRALIESCVIFSSFFFLFNLFIVLCAREYFFFKSAWIKKCQSCLL